jgi:hypothetical protein
MQIDNLLIERRAIALFRQGQRNKGRFALQDEYLTVHPNPDDGSARIVCAPRDQVVREDNFKPSELENVENFSKGWVVHNWLIENGAPTVLFLAVLGSAIWVWVTG